VSVQPSCPRAAGALAGIALLIAAWASAAGAVDPLNTLRAFCQADGRGDRIDPKTWPAIAGLVTWPLEPAWDHLYLIHGFELGTPKVRAAGLEIPVQYTVTAEVGSNGVQAADRVESRTYRLVRGDDGTWLIQAPPPPPYVFASAADPEALAALFDPEHSSYLSNSALAWRLLHGAGWDMPYADTARLATAPAFSPERTAQIGDLALYFDGEQAYHVAVVESDDTVVSSTLNGGIRRTPFGAFAGEIRYRRPIATPAPTPVATPRAAATAKPTQGK